MLNVPNVITLLRLALVPVTAYLLLDAAYGLALIVFLIAAVSDFLDGAIARTFNQRSELGAVLDPIADKLNMLVVTVMLALQGLLPVWLALAIVLRDIVIVAGAVAYYFSIGHVEIAPTLLSKLNTFLEFGLVLLIMASAAHWLRLNSWLPPIFLVVFTTVVASGAQYVWIWGRKAARESRDACGTGST